MPNFHLPKMPLGDGAPLDQHGLMLAVANVPVLPRAVECVVLHAVKVLDQHQFPKADLTRFLSSGSCPLTISFPSSKTVITYTAPVS